MSVKVKPLVWEPTSNGSWRADSVFGFYECVFHYDEYVVVRECRRDGFIATGLRTHVEAKSAAQADFEERIRSALE